MNGTTSQAASARQAKPPPTGPTPPAPVSAPPAPPTNAHTHNHPPTGNRQNANGTHASHNQQQKTGKKKNPEPTPVDPSQMYETLKNRIAVLEEDAVHEEEEERKFGMLECGSFVFRLPCL